MLRATVQSVQGERTPRMNDRDMSHALSRRRFLALTSTGVAGVGLLGMVACAPSAPATSALPAPTTAPAAAPTTAPAAAPTTAPAAAPTTAPAAAPTTAPAPA